MKILVFCALIFCLETVFAAVSIEPLYTPNANKSVVFHLKKPLVLSCNVTLDDEIKPFIFGVEWKKEGESYPKASSHITSTQGSIYSLKINEGSANDVGTWSCHVMESGEERGFAVINVVTTIAVRIKTDNINVVEGEKLRIECSVLGSPFPTLSWRIETDNYNGTIFDERVRIEDYQDDSGNTVENGVLVIDQVNKEDRGLFFCTGTNRFMEQNREVSKSMIRVKDKYAALWPFLGICIEVIVLCAVIIIYEKKRNKTELEESDTDQSPDQKNNTPDHGKESNLRQRQ